MARQSWVAARHMAISFAVMTLTLWLLPGVRAHDVVDVLGLIAVVAVVGVMLRPAVTAAATALGGPAALAFGVLAQALVMYVALRVDGDAPITGIHGAVLLSWTTAALSMLLTWLLDARTDEAFVRETARLMRRVRRRRARRATATSAPGMLVIQLDGVSTPVLRWALRAGNLPTLSRWLREGTHRAVGWHTGLPATTPAAQAGILYGHIRQVPGYRWYEKDTGTPMVMSRSRDAATVQARLPTDQGLLRGGGVSISNVFTGEATPALFTVSHGSLPGRFHPGWGAFAASPYGFTRAILLSIAEVVRELHQARLQRRRGVHPRISRAGRYLALRPAALMLRDANVSLIAEHMARGAPIIFCDFVDYDEVAHHAGPTRPEAMAMLERLDRMIGILDGLRTHAARTYQIVVLSDHGQCQGATFTQRHGESLQHLITRLCTAPDRVDRHPPVVAASGNLALIYFTDLPGRLTRPQIETLHPGLVDTLAAHPGIGTVVLADATGAPVAIGGGGTHRLDTGTVTGEDPLQPYGPHASRDLANHQQVAHVADLVLLGAVDIAADEVIAFEELVGSHGGLGGWQNDAMLVHPTEWPVDTGDLTGPDGVHRHLTHWRQSLTGPSTRPVTPPQRPAPATEPAVATAPASSHLTTATRPGTGTAARTKT